MTNCCGDNRFEIIKKAKKDILQSTNIEEDKDEMKVLDNFLFRCWQMDWLKKYETTKFPWISVKEDLPCNHEELIIKHDDWEILETKPVFVHYKNGGFGIRHMWKSKNEPWIWFPNTSDIDYWMPILELPKE